MTKRFGNAVLRNKAKRMIRECFRSEINQIRPMLVVVLPESIFKTSFSELKSLLLFFRQTFNQMKNYLLGICFLVLAFLSGSRERNRSSTDRQKETRSSSLSQDGSLDDNFSFVEQSSNIEESVLLRTLFHSNQLPN